MTIMEKVLALHEVDLFEHMGTEDLSILAAITEEDQFDKGDKLFSENEPADSLSLIISGKVLVLKDSREIFVAGPGDALGALSMLEGDPWLFSGEVREPTEILRIDRETFLDVIADHPSIIEAILRSLVRKVRRLVNTPVSGPSGETENR